MRKARSLTHSIGSGVGTGSGSPSPSSARRPPGRTNSAKKISSVEVKSLKRSHTIAACWPAPAATPAAPAAEGEAIPRGVMPPAAEPAGAQLSLAHASSSWSSNRVVRCDTQPSTSGPISVTTSLTPGRSSSGGSPASRSTPLYSVSTCVGKRPPS